MDSKHSFFNSSELFSKQKLQSFWGKSSPILIEFLWSSNKCSSSSAMVMLSSNISEIAVVGWICIKQTLQRSENSSARAFRTTLSFTSLAISSRAELNSISLISSPEAWRSSNISVKGLQTSVKCLYCWFIEVLWVWNGSFWVGIEFWLSWLHLSLTLVLIAKTIRKLSIYE